MNDYFKLPMKYVLGLLAAKEVHTWSAVLRCMADCICYPVKVALYDVNIVYDTAQQRDLVFMALTHAEYQFGSEPGEVWGGLGRIYE